MPETTDNIGERLAELVDKYCEARERAERFYGRNDSGNSEVGSVIAAKRAMADGLNAMLRPGDAVEGE